MKIKSKVGTDDSHHLGLLCAHCGWAHGRALGIPHDQRLMRKSIISDGHIQCCTTGRTALEVSSWL